jgi:hypothetical protein
MMSPTAQEAEFQIICLFKHNPDGDTYIEALKDFDDKLGGMLTALRTRGEFVGELGETISFYAPPKSIAAKRVMVIGLGDEASLSLHTLEIVGRVALREAVRLQAQHVAFASTIRDQGNATIDVGDGNRAVAENVVLAYDTEKLLQAEGLSAPFDVAEWLIEAGPEYYPGAVTKVAEGVKAADARIAKRLDEAHRQCAVPSVSIPSDEMYSMRRSRRAACGRTPR